MREARCETPGMRIPLLGGYRSSKRLVCMAWSCFSVKSSVFGHRMSHFAVIL